MSKLELALLVGAESKQFLADLTTQLDRLEKLQSAQVETSEVPAKPAAKPAKKAAKPEPVVEETEETEESSGLDEMFNDEAEPEVTVDDVRKVIKAFGAKHGKEKVLNALKKFKAQAISDIKKADYPKVIELLSKYI